MGSCRQKGVAGRVFCAMMAFLYDDGSAMILGWVWRVLRWETKIIRICVMISDCEDFGID